MNGVGTQTIAWADDRLFIDVWFCMFFLHMLLFACCGCGSGLRVQGVFSFVFSFLSLLLCNAFES